MSCCMAPAEINTSNSDRLKKGLLVIFSIGLSLLFAELGVRTWMAISAHRSASQWKQIAQTVTKTPGAKLGLAESIQLNANPKIIYELQPHLNSQFRIQSLHTNPEGFRVCPGSASPEEARYTLVGLGDSFMFGWDVPEDKNYLALLASELNSNAKAASWQIVNTAVPGYNTVMEVETLAKKGLSKKPDIVLLHYVVNDMDLPNFIQREYSFLTFKRSYLRAMFRQGFTHKNNGLTRLTRLPENLRDNQYTDPAKLPQEYRDLLGPEPFSKALSRLNELRDKHGFKVVVFSDFAPPGLLRTLCAKYDFTLIETEKQIQEHLLATGKNFLASDLILSPEDTHPSERGHRLIAETLLPVLKAAIQ